MVGEKSVELKIKFPSELYRRLQNLCGEEKLMEKSIIALVDHCSGCESFEQCTKINKTMS